MPKSGLTGAAAFEANLKRIGEAMERAVGAGLYLAANNVGVTSMENTPVDQGPLRASTYASKPEVHGTVITAEVGVGGPAETYAVDQHENMAYHHKEGTDHFLKKALDSHAGNLLPTVQKFAAQVLESGKTFVVAEGGLPTSPQTGQKGGGAVSGLSFSSTKSKKKPAKPKKKGPRGPRRVKIGTKAKRALREARKASRKASRRASKAAARLGKKALAVGKRASRRTGKHTANAARKARKAIKKLLRRKSRRKKR